MEKKKKGWNHKNWKSSDGWYVKDWHLARKHPIGFKVVRTTLNDSEPRYTMTNTTARGKHFRFFKHNLAEHTGKEYEIERIGQHYQFRIKK